MNTVSKVWEWFSGKKTVIGTVSLWVAGIGIPFIINDLGYHPGWFDSAVKILDWAGGILAPLGLGHKFVKATAKTDG